MEKLTLKKYNEMTPEEQEAVRENTPIGGITVAALGKLLHSMIAPLQAKVAALEKEVEGKAYFGVWDAAAQYSKGAVVSDKSNLWIAKRVNQGQRPGSSHDFWQLALRRGKDAMR